MIYLRKVLDMFFLSMIPSLISFIIMDYHMNYAVWFVCCILSCLVFFIGNALLIRRFVRDIKSPATYYTAWLGTFVVYTGLGFLCMIKDWMYIYTWIFFHARILAVLTMGTIQIPDMVSFSVSMALFLILIFAGRPFFLKRFQKEIAEKKERARNERHAAEQEHQQYQQQPSAFTQTEVHHSHHNSHHSADGNYSMRQLRKMDKIANFELSGNRKRIGAKKSHSQKTTYHISEFFLQMGSYEFYQDLADKVALGSDPLPIIKKYLKYKLHLGIKMTKKRK